MDADARVRIHASRRGSLDPRCGSGFDLHAIPYRQIDEHQRRGQVEVRGRLASAGLIRAACTAYTLPKNLFLCRYQLPQQACKAHTGHRQEPITSLWPSSFVPPLEEEAR